MNSSADLGVKAIRYNLLELVQSILSSLDGDEVNSVSDTTESLQVANIVKECYYDIVGEHQPPDIRGLFHLDASTDDTRPTQMSMPTHALSLETLKYNVDLSDDLSNTNFREIIYTGPQDFLDYMNGLDIDQDFVGTQIVTIQGQDFPVKFRNDQSPTYYTTFDDKVLIFDSFDSSVEDTLTSSRSYCVGALIKIFMIEDTFVPDLDPRHFQLLLQSAKAQAFVEVKQATNEKAERKERRNRLLLQKSNSGVDQRSDFQKHQEHFGMGRCGSRSTSVLNSRTRNGR